MTTFQSMQIFYFAISDTSFKLKKTNKLKII